MSEGLVNRIISFSSVDGPGNRTAIFLQGCNFNCLYCHNPETIKRCSQCGKCVKHCPYDALSIIDKEIKWDSRYCKNCDRCLQVCSNNSSPKAVKMTADEVMKKISRVKSFISGITISGGEATLQCNFITEVFKKAKNIGLSTFLDTNGSIPLFERNELVMSMDKAMVDLKSYDPKEHKFLTGMDNRIVLENIRFLSSINKLYEVRTVIVPEVLNNNYNVEMTSKLIASLDSSIRYKLIKYRPMGVRKELIDSHIPSDEMMEQLTDLAVCNGCKEVVNI